MNVRFYVRDWGQHTFVSVTIDSFKTMETIGRRALSLVVGWVLDGQLLRDVGQLGLEALVLVPELCVLILELLVLVQGSLVIAPGRIELDTQNTPLRVVIVIDMVQHQKLTCLHAQGVRLRVRDVVPSTIVSETLGIGHQDLLRAACLDS